MNSGELPLWITITQWASRLILLLLVGLSVWSVTTMLKCHRLLKQNSGGNDSDGVFIRLQNLIKSGKINEILKAQGVTIFDRVVQELAAVNPQETVLLDRSVRSLVILSRTEIEGSLTILATLGSNAPFIGLFGTVLGIIQAFGALGAQQSNGSSVMVGISEALVATAVGLFVAIPAVIAFNFLSRQLRVMLSQCDSLRDLYIAHLHTQTGR